MKNTFTALLFLIFFFSLSQNRKGEFRLAHTNHHHELYVSFYSDDFINHRNAQKNAIAKIKGFQNLSKKYSISLEKGIQIPDIEIDVMAKEYNTKFKQEAHSIKKLKKIYKVHITNATNERLYELAGELEKLKDVEYASLVSLTPIEPPYDILPITNNFESHQTYLASNPGVNMYYAWSLGLTGQNIRIRNIEYGFNRQHEELNEKNVSIARGMNISPYVSFNTSEHGTAVFGIVYGHKGNYGITGMAHGAQEMILYPEWQTSGYNRIHAISRAIADSRKGDVIIYEMQIWGRNNEYVPAEYNNVVWDLTKAATDRGIIVVAAAGNGNENLDAPFYNNYRSRGDSGAIIVGAGTPNLLHDRIYYSTYGSRVNLQAWGSNVLTSGYGNYAKIGNDPNQGYTLFSGTSSATPIVASCIIVLQSYYYSRNGDYLSPYEMRKLLIETGIPQGVTRFSTPIGPIPNMRNAISTIQKNRSISINDNDKKNELEYTIYPNPVKNKLNILDNKNINSKSKIEIYNQQSVLLYSELTNDSSIDIAHLPKGMYIIKIYNYNSRKIFISKIFKE